LEAKKVLKQPQNVTPSRPVARPQSAILTGKEGKDFRGIVRIVGRDTPGHMQIRHALRRIRGIGNNLSASIVRIIDKELTIKPDFEVGNLTDEQIAKIEEVLKSLHTKNIPKFLLNRPNEKSTGLPSHLLSTDLQFAVKQDINQEKDIRSWRGWRHSIGQKVRGQRTRSTGRTGMTVGVLKKALKAQKAAAATGAQDAGKDKK